MSNDPIAFAPMRAVTLQDIADRCGVTKVTVCRAFKQDHPHVSEKLARRIKEVAVELGYDPQRQTHARRLSLSRYGMRVLNHIIGLFFTGHFSRSRFHGALFDGMWSATTPQGYGLLTINAEFGDNEVVLPPTFSRGEVDGAIISAVNGTRLVDVLRNDMGFGTRPIVLLNDEHPTCSSVIMDRIAGARAAAEHLLALGHRHLGYIKQHSYVHEGYRQAFRDYDLDPEAYLHALEISPVCAVYSFDPSLVRDMRAPRRIPWPADEPFVTSLRANPQVTAILAPNDPAAVLMHFLLTREGWRVPEDISLVGFDDTEPLYDAEDFNILTTVRMPLEEAGAVAARLLTDRIEGHEPRDRQIMLPTELIVRGTTAAPAVLAR